VDCATPSAFARFTGRPSGTVGGIAQTIEWANFRALSPRSGAPGLYFVGDTVFPGAGTIGVTLSGLNVYRDVRAAARRAAVLRRISAPARRSAPSTAPDALLGPTAGAPGEAASAADTLEKSPAPVLA
jgi:hypothetical protein